MSSPLKNILLIGAGGRLGPYIISALQSDPQFTISILSRHSSTSTFPPSIQVHRIADDYPEAELLEAFKGQDAVVSTISRFNAEQQNAIVDAAIKAGVKRFMPSNFGIDSDVQKAVDVFPMLSEGKRDIVEYLRRKEGSGLTWTSFVTGVFFDTGMETGLMGFDLKARKATTVDDGNQLWAATQMKTVGLAVRNALLVPEKTANKTMFIDSFTVSQNQVLAVLEKATGKKWEVTHVDSDEERKIGQEKIAKRDFTGAANLIRYMNCVGGCGGDYTTYAESSNELLSLPKESLDDVVANIVKGVS